MLKTIISKAKVFWLGSPRIIVFELNDRIGPIDRGIVYEDPIITYLDAKKFGEVIGSGTYQLQSGELKSCDIQIELTSFGNNRACIQEIIQKFIDLGAPKGSKMTFNNNDQEFQIGELEGMAVYLDGPTLEREFSNGHDINDLTARFDSVLEYRGEAQRNWQTNESTALYYYGKSYDAMLAKIQPILQANPLGEGYRVEQIA